MESSNKSIYVGAVIVGSIVGGYIPSLFHASIFSLWSILGSAVVALLFLFIAVKIFNSS